MREPGWYEYVLKRDMKLEVDTEGDGDPGVWFSDPSDELREERRPPEHLPWDTVVNDEDLIVQVSPDSENVLFYIYARHR